MVAGLLSAGTIGPHHHLRRRRSRLRLGSGLLSARELSGRRRGRRLRRQREIRRRGAGGRHHDAGSARARLVGDRRAGAGARRAADPSDAALERALAQQAGVEVIGDIELFCRERAEAGLRLPAGRHHRHQRQIDHHRAHRASAQTAPAATCRWAAISAWRCWRWSRSRRGRVYVLEVSSYQIDLAPSLQPTVGILLNVSEDHLDRHGTHGELRRASRRCCRRASSPAAPR